MDSNDEDSFAPNNFTLRNPSSVRKSPREGTIQPKVFSARTESRYEGSPLSNYTYIMTYTIVRKSVQRKSNTFP